MPETAAYENLGQLSRDKDFMALSPGEKVPIFREVAQKDPLYKKADQKTQQEVVRQLFPDPPPKGALEPRTSLDPRTPEGRISLGMTAASVLAGGALAGPPGAIAFGVANLLGEEGTRRFQEEFGDELGAVMGLVAGVVSGGAPGLTSSLRRAPIQPGAKTPPGQAPPKPGATASKPGAPAPTATQAAPAAGQLSDEQRQVMASLEPTVAETTQAEQAALPFEVPPSRPPVDPAPFGPDPVSVPQSPPAKIQEVKDQLYEQFPRLKELQALAPPEGAAPQSARRKPNKEFPLDVLTEQQTIAQDFITPASIPPKGQAPKLVFVTGMPGSGKSEIIVKQFERGGEKYVHIDSDAIKQRLPGWDNTQPWLTHDEASVVAEQIILPRALVEGHNVIFDGVGPNAAKLMEFAKEARARGYEVEFYNISSDVAFNLQRAAARSLKPGGRNVPFGYIEGVAGRPEDAYTQIRRSGYVDRGKSWINPGREAPRERLAETFIERDSFGDFAGEHPLSLRIGRRDPGRGDQGPQGAQRPIEEPAVAAPGGIPATGQAPAVAGAAPSLGTTLGTAPPITKQAVAADLLEGYLRIPNQQKVITAAKEAFQSKQLTYDPDIPPSLQILDALNKGELTVAELEARGLTQQDIAGLYGPAKTFAGRTLQMLSNLDRVLAGDTAAQESLRKLADKLDDMQGFGSLWRRLENVRRGLMVSQLTTAARNFETQMGRVGLDVLQTPIDAGIQKMAGLPRSTDPLDGFERLMNIFKPGTKGEVNTILDAFPTQKERMFMSYNADIALQAKTAGVELPATLKAFDRADEVVAVLNTANRFQEFLTRRGVFQAFLDQRLRQKGISLEAIIQRNDVGKIPEEDVAAAVTKALDVTFAKQPSNAISRAFVDFFNKVPGASWVIPFPRFMVNSLRFLTEYSPAGFLRYLSAGEREALAAGNTEGASKALLGAAMLGTAWQIRNSEHAGEKWYEWKTDQGTVDLRPFNPFAAYLFMADVIKRKNEGTLSHLTTKDIALGVLSSNLRAGTGLYMLDKALEGIVGDRDPEDALRYLKEFGGELISTFGTPLQQITDLLGEFDDHYRTVKERRADPLTGPTKARAPFLGDTQEAELPTREGPQKRVHPFLYRQLGGVNINEPKNAIEVELDRLGFSRPEILKNTGDPDLDVLTARYMGPVVEKFGDVVLSTPGYQQNSDKGKAVLLSVLLEVSREEARSLAKISQGPEAALKRRLDGLPKRIRALLEEKGVKLKEESTP